MSRENNFAISSNLLFIIQYFNIDFIKIFSRWIQSAKIIMIYENVFLTIHLKTATSSDLLELSWILKYYCFNQFYIELVASRCPASDLCKLCHDFTHKIDIKPHILHKNSGDFKYNYCMLIQERIRTKSKN